MVMTGPSVIHDDPEGAVLVGQIPQNVSGTRHPAPGTRHPAPGTRHPAPKGRTELMSLRVGDA